MPGDPGNDSGWEKEGELKIDCRENRKTKDSVFSQCPALTGHTDRKAPQFTRLQGFFLFCLFCSFILHIRSDSGSAISRSPHTSLPVRVPLPSAARSTPLGHRSSMLRYRLRGGA